MLGCSTPRELRHGEVLSMVSGGLEPVVEDHPRLRLVPSVSSTHDVEPQCRRVPSIAVSWHLVSLVRSEG